MFTTNFISREIATFLESAMFRNYLLTVCLAVSLGGCMTLADIDAAFRRVDRAWQLDYQKTEDEFRYRVIDADFDVAFLATRKTFIDLGMPVQGASLEKGIVVAENAAPTPLSRDEWIEVAKAENPRVKELGGWAFHLADDPKDYIVIVKATLKALPGKTLILLDYELDSPKIRSMGVRPSRHAPPLAVQLGSLKFWSQLETRLLEVKVQPPRKRKPDEISI